MIRFFIAVVFCACADAHNDMSAIDKYDFMSTDLYECMCEANMKN